MNFTHETPASQLLHDRLLALADAAKEVREAMMSRLRDGPASFPVEQCEEMRKWVAALVALEMDAIKLKEEVD